MIKKSIFILFLVLLSYGEYVMEVVASYSCPTGGQGCVVSKREILWVANDREDDLIGYNISTGAEIDRIASPYTEPGPQGITYDYTESCLWVGEHRRGVAYEPIFAVDEYSGEILDEFCSPYRWPEGITVIGDYLYMVAALDLDVKAFNLRSADHEEIHSFPMPIGSNGLTYNGSKILFGNGHRFYMMDPETGVCESYPAPIDIDGMGYEFGEYYWCTNTPGSTLWRVRIYESSSMINTEEFTPEEEFAIYPNPTSNNIYINGPQNAKSDGIITIYDSIGKKLYSQRMSNSTTCLRLMDNLPSQGVYFIQINSENLRQTKKVILQ